MKQNLNYFGDVLLFGNEKDSVHVEEVVDDQFELDSAEKDFYLKLNETEESQATEGEQFENEEATSDVGDIDAENEQIDEWDVDY